MGLIANIYRSDFSAPHSMNLFAEVSTVTVMNVEGPFQPDEAAPAVIILPNALREPVLVPAVQNKAGGWEPLRATDGRTGPMFGGNYVATSDSRFRDATRVPGAIPLHDRYEDWTTMARMV